MSSETFSLLYTVYSLPNMILPIFGGIFLDKLGVRNGLILFTTISTIGQFIFMIGGYQGSYNMMVFGRIIFGAGAESMLVA